MNKTSTQAKHMALGQLYTNEITDPRLLNVLAQVPREMFVPPALKGAAYVDEDLEIAPGRYLMEPMVFAKLLSLAEVGPSERVLCIGALTGYCAAVLGKLAGHVVATELDAAMVSQAGDAIRKLGIGDVDCQAVASLRDGYALSAPYDVIIICGAVEFVPEDLGKQLSLNGRLVTVRNVSDRPGVKGALGKGVLVRKLEQKLEFREYFDASCRLVPGFEPLQTFRF